jgi:hypothetical protein
MIRLAKRGAINEGAGILRRFPPHTAQTMVAKTIGWIDQLTVPKLSEPVVTPAMK